MIDKVLGYARVRCNTRPTGWFGEIMPPIPRNAVVCYVTPLSPEWPRAQVVTPQAHKYLGWIPANNLIPLSPLEVLAMQAGD